MVAIEPLISEFDLVGRLEDLVVDSKGRVKYLYLSTSEGEYTIEVAKQKSILAAHLQSGCNLRVAGMRKNKLHQAEVKYKAYRIELLARSPDLPKDKAVNLNKAKSKILVCQGSSCLKRGGKTAYELLQTELHKTNLANKVEIQTTGCLKQCKQAPNLIMPGGNRYSRVKPEQISRLVSKHFK